MVIRGRGLELLVGKSWVVVVEERIEKEKVRKINGSWG